MVAVQAFDDKENPYLPEHILWRQKEQFSDGVGYGWIDSLRDLANNEVSDQMFRSAQHRCDNPSTCLTLFSLTEQDRLSWR
jgi:asparagine synthetase B (glutamine-hydrolysing)